MATPTLITELSTTAAANAPAGSDSPSTLDDIQRAHASFIAQLRDRDSAFALTLLDDANAAAARTTLGAAASGANTDITSLSGLVGAGLMPVGAVIHIASNTAPVGYLKANGALLSRVAYASLFAIIGTAFGVGDGSTTFALPDLRGEFLRGLDDSRGVDSGRSLGTPQGGMSQINPGVMVRSGSFSGSDGTHDASGVSTTANINDLNAAPHGSTGSTYPETRPRNIALLACIKF